MILRNFISLQAFTVYMENSLRFEICTEVSFTLPELVWTLIMKLSYTEVKFYPEVKSQTGLSLIRVLCTSALHQIRKIDSWIIYNICKTSTTRKCYVIPHAQIQDGYFWSFSQMLGGGTFCLSLN